MKCQRTKVKVSKLVDSWVNASLKVNPEYQRGASWTPAQQQGLLDSFFRNYPIPPLFLHRIVEQGLDGTEVARFEIVDGQQRIRALASYFKGEFPLLRSEDKKLRLPNSLRNLPARWGGQTFAQLADQDREYLMNAEIEAFQIENVANPDEIRDLFIRLQSGTALSRQQIRDAWPGNIGPYIESLAGKMGRQPKVDLFRGVDRRGQRVEDERDQFEPDRQLCAQLLCAFLAHVRDALRPQSVTANDLDAMYHARTDFDSKGPEALLFERSLAVAADCVQAARARPTSRPNGKTQRKFRKLEIAGLVLVASDLLQTTIFKFNRQFYDAAADQLLSDSTQPSGKTTSGTAILEKYKEWQVFATGHGVRLDSQRLFDEKQRAEIYDRDNRVCKICGHAVEMSDAEIDHYPVPHASGGKTVVENGRLVCASCHPRGRAAGQMES